MFTGLVTGLGAGAEQGPRADIGDSAARLSVTWVTTVLASWVSDILGEVVTGVVWDASDTRVSYSCPPLQTVEAVVEY